MMVHTLLCQYGGRIVICCVVEICQWYSYFDSSFIAKWLEKDGKVPKEVITCGYSNSVKVISLMSKVSFSPATELFFALGEKLYKNSGAIHTIYAFLGIIYCVFLPLRLVSVIQISCDVIRRIVNFHICTLLSVKIQDPGVLVRAKSYKSKRKNEEPWRLQVFAVHYCFV